MTKDEALRLALEALEEYTSVVTSVNDPNTWVKVADGGKPAKEAITAIKAALEAKDEPVAWISPTELLVMRGNALGGAKDWRVNVGLKPEDGDVGLYTTTPQRKPLTQQQINQMMADAGWQNSAIRQADLDKVKKVARAIEAAHGIKGEA